MEVSNLNSSDRNLAKAALAFVVRVNKPLQRLVQNIIDGSIIFELQSARADDPATAQLLSLVEAVLGASFQRAYLQLGVHQLLEVLPGARLRCMVCTHVMLRSKCD